MAGISNPKLETFHSINRYSKTLGLDSINIIFSKDSLSFIELSNAFIGSPEMLVFDKEENYIPYKDDLSTCNAPVDNTLQNICLINKNGFRSSRKLSLEKIRSCFIDPNNVLKDFDFKKFDYLVLINYSKYTDGINKTHIIPWDDLIRKNRVECRVKYVYVNLDYLESWGINKNSLPRLKIKTI
jgi:hypothetical protein